MDLPRSMGLNPHFFEITKPPIRYLNLHISHFRRPPTPLRAGVSTSTPGNSSLLEASLLIV